MKVCWLQQTSRVSILNRTLWIAQIWCGVCNLTVQQDSKDLFNQQEDRLLVNKKLVSYVLHTHLKFVMA